MSNFAGFGSKNADNSFTGVGIGTIRQGTTTRKGLIGYGKGECTFFVNAETGDAKFKGDISGSSGTFGNTTLNENGDGLIKTQSE
jgi:hypothetical protein